jgi:vacuolar-type H+-ATPase subunit E/Vma4
LAIEALRTAILAEGRERVADVRREALQQAARVRAEAQEALAQRVERASHELEQRVRRELAARITAARREARARVFAERDALLARVFDAAQQTPAAGPEAPALRAAFERRLSDALERLDGEVTVRCPQALVQAAEAVASARPEVRVEPAPEIGAGFRAHAVERDVEIDATLSQLLALRRPQLSIAVLRRLGGSSEGPAA